MQLVGLNGNDMFSWLIPGTIDHHFDRGVFPYRPTWNTRGPNIIKNQIKFVQAYVSEPYILVGFSAGGNFAQILAPRDPLCRGLVIHSANFLNQHDARIPTLIIYTRGDKTGVNRDLTAMISRYSQVTVHEQQPTTWLAHEFQSTTPIKDWYEQNFDLWDTLSRV